MSDESRNDQDPNDDPKPNGQPHPASQRPVLDRAVANVKDVTLTLENELQARMVHAALNAMTSIASENQFAEFLVAVQSMGIMVPAYPAVYNRLIDNVVDAVKAYGVRVGYAQEATVRCAAGQHCPCDDDLCCYCGSGKAPRPTATASPTTTPTEADHRPLRAGVDPSIRSIRKAPR